jgi:hypothetical protein
LDRTELAGTLACIALQIDISSFAEIPKYLSDRIELISLIICDSTNVPCSVKGFLISNNTAAVCIFLFEIKGHMIRKAHTYNGTLQHAQK